MKKLQHLTLAILLASSISYAVDWKFDTATYTSDSYNFADTLGDETTNGYWYTEDTEGNKTYIKGSYAEGDTFTFRGGNAANQILNITGVTIGALNTAGTVGANASSATLTVLGNYVQDKRFSDIKNLTLTAGNIVIGTEATQSSELFNITGNATIMATGSASSYGAGLANPDILINGILRSAQTTTIKRNGADSYVKVFGLGRYSALSVYDNADPRKNKTTYMILANTSAVETDINNSAGNRVLSAITSWKKEGSLKFIVNMGENGSQKIRYNVQRFDGGIELNSGTLTLNFAQEVSKYTVYGMTAYEKDGTTLAQFSHGNLDLNGGVFASEGVSFGDNVVQSACSFRFTDINYTGGEIQLRMDVDDNGTWYSDYLDIRGYTNKHNNAVSETEEGGVVTVAEGKQMTFVFSDDAKAWLASFSEDEKGTMLIAWDEAQTVDSNDFYAEGFTQEDLTYRAEFTTATDGLYVKYVAVPEPSTYAAIFGAVALVLAYIRRRK